MPLLNLNLDAIQRARGELVQQRDTQRDAGVKLKQAQAGLDDLLRSGAGEQLVKRQQARVRALQGEARDAVSGTVKRLTALKQLSQRLLSQRDPAVLVQALSSAHPVMLLPVAASPELTIQEFIDNILGMHRQSAFPVAKDRKLLGMLLLEDMKAVDRGEWRNKTIGDVMRPVESDHFVEVGTSLSDARELARLNGVGSVGIIGHDGLLVGVVRAVSSRTN